MSKRPRLVAGVLLLASCLAAPDDAQRGSEVVVGNVTLRAPADWQTQSLDASSRQVWTPDDNFRKESLAIRVVPRPAQDSDESLLDSVTRVVSALPSAKVTRREKTTTKRGLPSLFVELTFVPPGQNDRYTRAHATFVGRTNLIHIFYTARQPEAGLVMLRHVMETVVEEETP